MIVEILDTFKYKSTDIAYYIVSVANERRVSVNMTKIQKLLYITYGVFLRVCGERLTNEHPQAWPYGPVFPTTRNKLIKKDLSCASREDIGEEVLEKIETDDTLKKVIDFVFDKFGSWNAGQLSEWSHSEGSPWEKTKNSQNFKWGNIISDQDIYEYFCRIISIKSEE